MKSLPEPTYNEIRAACQGILNDYPPPFDVTSPTGFLQAVRAYRERSYCSLKEAVDAMDGYNPSRRALL